MKTTKDPSIRLTIICVYVFAAILLLADIFAFKWVRWYVDWRLMSPAVVKKMLITFYTASVFGWVCLWSLFNLLSNISKALVFSESNVRLMRIIAWCCGIAAVIFLLSGAYYAPFLLVAVAAAFMMLIVRVVRNAFMQAIEMKSELDLTI